MKHFLLVDASPRKGGNSEVITDELARLLQGHEATVFKMREKKCNFCLACAACQNKDYAKCVQEDDISALLPVIENCDGVVLATPMEELYREGKVRAIGVCNFLADRLADLILSHEIVPAVNQIELHPFCQQRNLREVMKRYDIAPMAWAPFAEGQNGLFSNQTLAMIGEKYGKTPGQVVLRWLRQNDIIAIPKSVHEERIEQNFAVDDFTLSEEDMRAVETLDNGHPLILDITSLDEVYRLHGIKFEQ